MTSEQEKTPAYARWFGLGIEFGGVIAVFCYIGYRIDAAYDTSPYFLLGGFFFGFIGMFYLVIKQTFDFRQKNGEK